METIQQLMVAMTFSDGNAAISPKCWHRDRAGGFTWLSSWVGVTAENCKISRAVRTAGLRFGRFPKVLGCSAGAAAWSIPDIHTQVLCSVKTFFETEALCSGGCSGSVVLACANRNHNSGLCKKCANQASLERVWEISL